MEDILLKIAEQGPIIALLIAAIIYFLRREKKKDEEIAKLNEELRENDKEHLTALMKVTALMERILDKLKGNG